MASLVVAQLLFLESENPEKPIFMYINSPGGLITAGMAIYDTMQVGGDTVSWAAGEWGWGRGGGRVEREEAGGVNKLRSLGASWV